MPTCARSGLPPSATSISVPRMPSTRIGATHISGFHQVESPKPGRGRIHIDVSVPADQAEARAAAALAAGGRIADDSRVPEWWTLASPDNHGVDIAAWPDFEDYES